MEITGTIKHIGPVEPVTTTFSKRECVIVTDEMYPQTLSVQFAQSRMALLDYVSVGQKVTISINLQSREWTDPRTGEVKYFTAIAGWRIADAGAPVQTNTAPAQRQANPFSDPNRVQAAKQAAQDDDDLPF